MKWHPGEPDRRKQSVTINSGGESDGGALKAFGAVIAIVALITGIAAIVTPMQQRIDALVKEIEKVEARHTVDENKIDQKIQVEIDRLDTKLQLEIARCHARLEKLERLGIKYAEESLGDIAVLQQQAIVLEKQISDLKTSEIALLKERISDLSKRVEDLSKKTGGS